MVCSDCGANKMCLRVCAKCNYAVCSDCWSHTRFLCYCCAYEACGFCLSESDRIMISTFKCSRCQFPVCSHHSYIAGGHIVCDACDLTEVVSNF